MGTKTRDTAEQIDKCLSCQKQKCNNCVDDPAPIKDAREAEFTRLYNLGYGDVEIAKIMNVSRQTVAAYRWRKGIEPNKKSKDTVLVVRCKYCKHHGTTFCPMISIYEYPYKSTAGDDFCSYGERKTV